MLQNLSTNARRIVADALIDASAFWHRSELLPLSNPFVADFYAAVAGFDQNGDASDLIGYIALSAVLHAQNAWSYFSRAAQAIISGDAKNAVHLSYYAELRATLSILATEGIAIFDRRHFVVSDVGRATRIVQNGGTHVIAWQALDVWSNDRRAIGTLGGMITWSGRTLVELLDEWQPGAPVRALASDWLSTWGLDLQRLATEKRRRDTASYRPSFFNVPNLASLRDGVETIQDCWLALRPRISQPYDALDAQLIFEAGNALFMQGGQGALMARSNVVDQDDSSRRLLLLARGSGADGDPDLHLQMLARAFMLLRLAGGSVSRMFADAGLAPSEIAFSFADLSNRFYLPPFADLDSPLDVLVDINDALTALSNHSSAVTNLDMYIRDRATDLLVLTQAERAAIAVLAS